MAEFLLPTGSKVVLGKTYEDCDPASAHRSLKIYRYNVESGTNPRIDTYLLGEEQSGQMVLDALIYIKNYVDSSLSFRRSCREGVCGSCAMNVDGINTLACIKPLSEISGDIKVYPLPHMPVIKDLVCNLDQFYRQIAEVKPWMQATTKNSHFERPQSEAERNKLDGLYECILCACCSTACPSYWWNGDEFLGPAAILQSYRWIVDSRDDAAEERLAYLDDKFRLYRCHTIMNCTKTCPKGLNPSKAISQVKSLLSEKDELL